MEHRLRADGSQHPVHTAFGGNSTAAAQETSSTRPEGPLNNVNTSPSHGSLQDDRHTNGQDSQKQPQPKPSSAIYNSKSVTTAWRAAALLSVTFATFIVTTIALTAGIITVTVLSSLRHGFPLSNPAGKVLGFTWRHGLLWTVLPTLVFQLLRICFDAVVSALSNRQPYVELEKGAEPEKTILLDYRTDYIGKRQLHACRNKHFLLCASFTLSVVLALGISPLSARLFAEAPFTVAKTLILRQNVVFWQRLRIDQYLPWDLDPVLGITSALDVYGAASPLWIDSKSAYLNFTLPPLAMSANSPANLTADTTSYFAQLDCQTLNPSAYDQNFTPNPSHPSTAGSLTFNASDRGCDWSVTFDVSADFSTYLKISNNVQCGQYLQSAITGRMGFVYANINFLTISNLAIFSCIPTYWTSNGSLHLGSGIGGSARISDFSQDDNTVAELRPGWWNSFETQVTQVKSIDTTTYFKAYSTTTLGRLVLSYSQKRFPHDPIGVSSLQKSAEDIYRTAYAVTVNSYMWQPAKESNTTGTLYTSNNRLFVVPWIAYVIIGVLAILLVILVLQLLYTTNHPASLYEEPVGLMGQAGILWRSDINEIAHRARTLVREGKAFDGKTSEAVKQVFLESEYAGATFQLQDPHKPQFARIVMVQPISAETKKSNTSDGGNATQNLPIGTLAAEETKNTAESTTFETGHDHHHEDSENLIETEHDGGAEPNAETGLANDAGQSQIMNPEHTSVMQDSVEAVQNDREPPIQPA